MTLGSPFESKRDGGERWRTVANGGRQAASPHKVYTITCQAHRQCWALKEGFLKGLTLRSDVITAVGQCAMFLLSDKPFISLSYKNGPVVEATAGQKSFKLQVNVSAFPTPETQW